MSANSMNMKGLAVFIIGVIVAAGSYYGWQAKRTTGDGWVIDQDHQYSVRTTSTNSSDQSRSVTPPPESKIEDEVASNDTTALAITERGEKPLDHTSYKAKHVLPKIQSAQVPRSVAIANSLNLTPIKTLNTEELSPPTMMKGSGSNSGAVSSVGGAYSIDSAYEAPVNVINSVSRDTGISSAELQQAFD